MPSQIVLQLERITRTYMQGGKVLNVLSGVNLDIKAGELVALVGPSGSGKTTLLQIAGLLDTPTAGSISVGGQAMEKSPDAERTSARGQKLGFVYQFHHLLPEFSALENVAMPLLIAGASHAAAAQKASELLASLGLADRETHRPARLSGGEQQRVAIARALIHDPVLLLADEPTGNLDPETAEQVFAMFLKLARERKLSALVATHNMELARRMDRTLRLEGGTLI